MLPFQSPDIPVLYNYFADCACPFPREHGIILPGGVTLMVIILIFYIPAVYALLTLFLSVTMQTILLTEVDLRVGLICGLTFQREAP